MAANKRIYYATKGLAVKKSGAHHGVTKVMRIDEVYPGGTVGGIVVSTVGPRYPSAYGMGQVSTSGIWEVPRGVQSVGITSTHNLEDVFQQGQLAVYEQVEDRPEIEMTVSRVLDGTQPLYLMATDDLGLEMPSGAHNVNIRANGYSVDLALLVYADTVAHASGTTLGNRPDAKVLASGMFISSVSYTFPVEGNATEECTFVGNDKFWSTDAKEVVAGVARHAGLGSFPDPNMILIDEDPTTPPFAEPIGGYSSGVTRREDIILHGLTGAGSLFGLGTAAFPTKVPGNDIACIQNITVSVDLGQEEILCLGSKSASTRYVTFPIEVTSSFEVVTSAGDKVDANHLSTLPNESIVIITKQGLKIDLGTKNKLASVDFSGGDTGGGNVSVTYNYRNSNEFTVSHARFA